MKIQFQKEGHNRQDKTKKGDYLEEIRERGPTEESWSGANMERLRRRKSVLDAELRQATSFFFVYGKWLYQNTKSLAHFAQLNGNQASLVDPDLEAAFQKCRQNWQADFTKVLEAITRGRFAQARDLPRCFPSGELVGWELPTDVIADEVWRKMPPAFKRECIPKGVANKVAAPSESKTLASPNSGDSL